MVNMLNKFRELNWLIYGSIFSSAISVLLLTLFPNFDIFFSNLFYSYGDGFIYRNNFIVQFLFKSIPILTKSLFVIVLLYLVYLVVISKVFNRKIINSILYVILSISVGPGLLVNHVFKENSGRARPAQIKDFGGNKNFTSVFQPSRECLHNCSFSSGHAAMAYSLTSFAYIFPALFSRIYCTALFFGSLVGLSRILMGGHFLSDIIASCCIVLTINHLLYLCLQKLKLTRIE